jgi:uncharacterized protein YggE
MEDDNMRKIIFAVLLIALIALTGCQQGNVLTAAGNYEITVDPDEAEVWAGVSVVDVSADLAQNEVNEVMNDMINALKKAGISESDMSTERLSLHEERRWEEGKSTVVGWRATQILKIKTDELDKVGTIVDIAVENGANQIQNINFGLSVEKENEYKNQALAEATKSAKKKAETMASSLGVKLKGIKSISESGYYARPYTYMMEAKVDMDEVVAEAAQVMPGDVTVSANVNVVYYVG